MDTFPRLDRWIAASTPRRTRAAKAAGSKVWSPHRPSLSEAQASARAAKWSIPPWYCTAPWSSSTRRSSRVSSRPSRRADGSAVSTARRIVLLTAAVMGPYRPATSAAAIAPARPRPSAVRPGFAPPGSLDRCGRPWRMRSSSMSFPPGTSGRLRWDRPRCGPSVAILLPSMVEPFYGRTEPLLCTASPARRDWRRRSSKGNAVDKIWPCDDDESTRFPIFTRANTGEVFTDAATPLTWSVLGRGVYENGYRDALYQMGVFTPADFRPEFEGEVVGCFGGYVYINVSLSRVLAVRTPGMDWRAIDQAFFGESSEVPPYQPHPLDENQQCSERMVEWMTSLFTATSVPAIDSMRAEIDAVVGARPAPT